MHMQTQAEEQKSRRAEGQKVRVNNYQELMGGLVSERDKHIGIHDCVP